jgi:flagellar assembly protein FliH
MSPEWECRVEHFQYPPVGTNEVMGEVAVQAGQTPALSPAELDTLCQNAYWKGVQEGEQRACHSHEAALQSERHAIAGCARQFAAEREQYFRRIETEVVQLALSIAAKVLQREANVDSLLLAGAVKVALERLHQTSGTRLTVHPSRAQLWREHFASSPEAGAPEVVENAALATEQCVLESSLGTIELGIDAQLAEIERGLFDLVGRRPESAKTAKGAAA